MYNGFLISYIIYTDTRKIILHILLTLDKIEFDNHSNGSWLS